MRSPQFTLRVTEGVDYRRRFDLDLRRDGAYIGRHAKAAVQLNDGLVSRVHAMLHFYNGRLRITDFDSANGTGVNGKRLPRRDGFYKWKEIRPGDEIVIGKTRLCLEAYEPPVILAPRRSRLPVVSTAWRVAAALALGIGTFAMPSESEGGIFRRMRERRQARRGHQTRQVHRECKPAVEAEPDWSKFPPQPPKTKPTPLPKAAEVPMALTPEADEIPLPRAAE